MAANLSTEVKQNFALRTSCLILLTIQTSTLILLMRHSLHRAHYIPASVVVTVEVAKLILSICAEVYTRPPGQRSLVAVMRSLKQDIQHNYLNVAKLAVPALLYAIQNNLSYFALARLSAVSFQVIQQLKILTTALMAVWLMGKRLTVKHWIALCLLTAGVICVQLANVSDDKNSLVKDTSPWTAWMGFGAMLLNSLSSGFAGIYFERLVKTTPTIITPARRVTSMLRMSTPMEKGTIMTVSPPPRSVWLQSIELGLFGLLFSIILAFTGSNASQIINRGFFTGYDHMTLIVIAMQAAGGILVAMVVRYADSILKAFATSASIVLSSVITFGVLGASLTIQFVIGAALVTASVYIYAVADRAQHLAKAQ